MHPWFRLLHLHCAPISCQLAGAKSCIVRGSEQIRLSGAALPEPDSVIEAANSAGPATPANFSNTEKKPKYSVDRCTGTMRANVKIREARIFTPQQVKKAG